MTEVADKVSEKAADYTEQQAFIRENSTTDEKGVLTMARSDYYKYQETLHGNTRAVVDSVKNGDSEILSAAMVVAGDNLVAKINEAKAAGQAVEDLQSFVHIGMPGARAKITASAVREVNDPHNKTKMIKHGMCSVTISVSSGVKKDAAAIVAERVKAAVG